MTLIRYRSVSGPCYDVPMNINEMTPEDLLAYDQFCSDLADFGDTDGEFDNLTHLFPPF